MTVHNVWTERFSEARELLEGSLGKVIVEHSIEKNKELEELPDSAAVAQLKETLGGTIVISPNVYMVANKMLSHFEEHAFDRYPDEQTFVTRIHSKDYKPIALPVCQSGLAGVGKSQLCKLVSRLVVDRDVLVKTRAGRFPVIGFQHIEDVNEKSAGRLVERFKPKPGVATPKTDADRIIAAGRRLYTSGSAGVCLDELQFVSASSQASAQVTSLLLGVCQTGVPWGFNCNYSLLTKLVRRNQEDIDRLLSNILLLEPEVVGSQASTVVVSSIMSVVKDVFPADDLDLCKKISELTFGINRKISKLLVLAYRSARSRGVNIVCDADIMEAYNSTQYRLHKSQVNALKETSGWRLNKGFSDLECPLDSDGIALEEDKEHVKNNQVFLDRYLEQSLNKTESLNYFALKKENNQKRLGSKETIDIRSLSNRRELEDAYNNIL